ncbi:MAG: hydroxymethylbilane synthase [Alphaproteobacteria bacterium]|nr:hydroxymethylbilane synthase [Alphaproteobacteria bacterium]
MKAKIKIGTRGSPLALAQVDVFVSALVKAHPHLKADGAIEIVKISTLGDRTQAANTPLPEDGGGKAYFAKEIEAALLDGAIDCAVHSLKDMPAILPEGLVIPCVLPREDPRDVFFARDAKTIEDLPEGAVVGTTSPRRGAFLLAMRPDLKIVTFRGNVGTRLKKLEDGVVDATLLAVAGLNRLGLSHLAKNILDPAVMLPAAAQGAIGIEVREDDAALRDMIAPAHCAVTELRVTAERAFLEVMDGSCRTPLAALMEAPDPEGRARFDVAAANPDGTGLKKLSYLMSVQHVGDAERLGRHAGKEMREKCKAS